MLMQTVSVFAPAQLLVSLRTAELTRGMTDDEEPEWHPLSKPNAMAPRPTNWRLLIPVLLTRTAQRQMVTFAEGPVLTMQYGFGGEGPPTPQGYRKRSCRLSHCPSGWYHWASFCS